MFLEVCDTKKYLDSEIESEITVEIKNLTDEKIGVSINVDDDFKDSVKRCFKANKR